jgi:hypothetical protein
MSLAIFVVYGAKEHGPLVLVIRSCSLSGVAGIWILMAGGYDRLNAYLRVGRINAMQTVDTALLP